MSSELETNIVAVERVKEYAEMEKEVRSVVQHLVDVSRTCGCIIRHEVACSLPGCYDQVCKKAVVALMLVKACPLS